MNVERGKESTNEKEIKKDSKEISDHVTNRKTDKMTIINNKRKSKGDKQNGRE